jgi:molecular chaperone DnaK
MKAAKLAGFKHVELLQEPVAAATAYGLGAKSKDGFWLCLILVVEHLMQH